MNEKYRMRRPEDLTPAEILLRRQIAEVLADAACSGDYDDRSDSVLPPEDARLNPYAIAVTALASVSAAQGGTMPSLRPDRACFGMAAEVTVPRLRLDPRNPLPELTRDKHVTLDMEAAPRGLRVTLHLNGALQQTVFAFEELCYYL